MPRGYLAEGCGVMTPTGHNDVQCLGHAVLITGPALADTRNCVLRAVRVLRSDGIAPPPRLQDLVTALEVAIAADALSRNGQCDVASPDLLTPLLSVQQRIGTTEAASILGLSRRHVQRIAHSLEGKRVGSRMWTFDRDTVATYRRHDRETE